MMVNCASITVFCASAGQSSCDRNSGEWLQDVWYGAPESGWPSSDSTSNVITCLEPLLNCQCRFKFWGCTAIVTFERNLLHRLRSEINIKKVQKQDFKNIKNVKGCRDGMPKSMQTR